MKYIKWMLIPFMVIFVIGSTFTVFALDSGLTTQTLSDEEKADVAARSEFVKITSHKPAVVKCFDVRDDGMVVLGSKGGNTAVIAVYNDHGTFQYGFKMEESGSFRVMWSGDAIAYYSIRGNIIFTIDEDGKIIDIRRVDNTTKNSVYDQEVLLSTTRTVGSDTYRMTNEWVVADALPGSFKKIIKTNADSSTVIYDATGNRRARTVGGTVVFLIFSSLIVCSIIVGVKKQGRQGDGSVS